MKRTLQNTLCQWKNWAYAFVIGTAIGLISPFQVNGQNGNNYRAPQDTVKTKRSANTPLTVYTNATQPYTADSRMVGAAVKAAERLTDTAKYDNQQGILLEQLFSAEDLAYFAKQNVNAIVALFELVNSYLPNGKVLIFKTAKESTVATGENPLVLKDLRAIVAANPANVSDNSIQWKENVYHAYMARDYGTKLENTITITSATREIRETPDLKITDFDGKIITIGDLLSRASQSYKEKDKAEMAAVQNFRLHTFPNQNISKETANKNYRQALFELIRLQEEDIKKHPESVQLIADLSADISKGKDSRVINGLKNSAFFDANVPGNLGPVLLLEDKVVDAERLKTNARDKALELIMLTALHYGERDAVKLYRKLLAGKGPEVAAGTNEFTAKRLNELTYHGTEKFKSLGYGKDKTASMTFSDLVLVAVAAPETPVIVTPKAFLSLSKFSNQQVGQSIVNYYNTVNEQRVNNVILFSPQISIGTRHTEYRASFDAVDYVPEIVNGSPISQKGSRVTQNGVEVRFGSDIYFANPAKLFKSGLKPFFYPEFGVLLGAGSRRVGFDNSTTVGPLGAVPQFKNTYFTWGGHAGMNVSAFSLGVDATFMTTPRDNQDPYVRFFDLSQGMTYYRYSLLTHIADFGVGKKVQQDLAHIIIDLEFTGETNNTGLGNKTITESGSGQIGNGEWSRDYARAHPNGTYDVNVARQMIIDGDVKANYAASNYGAIHVGFRKSGFLVKATGGLYNLYSVTGKNLISGQLFKNTINGNFFGAVSLTYNFRSGSKSSNYKKSESYQIINNVESPHKIDESTTQESSQAELRNRAIFTNKKSRIKATN